MWVVGPDSQCCLWCLYGVYMVPQNIEAVLLILSVLTFSSVLSVAYLAPSDGVKIPRQCRPDCNLSAVGSFFPSLCCVMHQRRTLMTPMAGILAPSRIF